MAVARMGSDSDLYIFHHINGGIWVYGLPHELAKNSPEADIFDSEDDLLIVLHDAVERGLKVPDHAFYRLEREKKERETQD